MHKIAYKSACMADRRCLGLLGGFGGWPIQWNHVKCCGANPCCHGNDIRPRRGDPDAYQLVRLSVCHGQTSNWFLFCLSMESSHFWPSVQFSMWHSTKRCSSTFHLGPLTPKIYSPKLLAITLQSHVATRGRAHAHSAVQLLSGESGQCTELRGWPLLPWQRNLA